MDKVTLLFQIEQLKEFIANNVDPSYFKEGSDEHLIWLACHYHICPENYESDPVDYYKKKIPPKEEETGYKLPSQPAIRPRKP